MLKTSLLLSLLSAMLSAEHTGKSMERSMRGGAQKTLRGDPAELADNERIEAEARQSVAHSMVDDM